MKTYILASLIGLMISPSAFAWLESAPVMKPYSFKFKLKTDSFEYTRKAASYDEAYESAAQACFSHYKNGHHLNENEGLDIIDVCANPRKG